MPGRYEYMGIIRRMYSIRIAERRSFKYIWRVRIWRADIELINRVR